MRGAWQVNPKGGSFADFAVNRHGSAGLLGKPVNHAQAEASALVHFFGCKEGLKGATADLLSHAGSRVGHRDQYVIARIDGGKPAAASMGYVLGGNRQSSTR